MTRDIEDMTDAQDEALKRRLERLLRELITDQSCGEWGEDTIDAHVQMFLPRIMGTVADLARPSQAGDERVARALGVVAAVLQGEADRQAGVPFSGEWSIPDYNWRGTVSAALEMAETALAAMDTPKGGGDE